MAENGVTRMGEGQRWTSKKKAEAVLEIIKGNQTLVDFCRANDLKQSDVQKWISEFVAGGTQCLKANPRDLKSEHRKELDQLKHVIGEQALDIRILKKSIELQEQEESEL